jgi:Flp pilus assembly CpaE family ATPase
VRSDADSLTSFQLPRLRVALGLGDQELEQRLRPGLESAEDLAIVAQCLSADHVLDLVHTEQVDAVVVAWTLHRLTDSVLQQLERPGVTLVLLVPDSLEPRWASRTGPVLALDSEAEAVYQSVVSARPGARKLSRPAPAPQPIALKPVDRAEPPRGRVVAVAGGAGSPGRTTLAINLATALGAAVPTVLVDLDLCAPAVAAYVDADPSRNICTLAHAVGEDPHTWAASLAEELQPLGPGSTHAMVLCGPPKREMRGTVSASLVERLLAELAQRFEWVIVDVGPEWLGVDSIASCHRTALATAEHLLLVTAANVVGLWHARTALDHLQRLLEIDSPNVNLVLNRYDSRFHHARQEVEWHLGALAAAVVPFDRQAFEKAILDQRPVVLDSSSRAARALVQLAEGMYDGKLHLPSPSLWRTRPPWWRRMFRRGAAPTITRPLVRSERPQPAAVAGARGRAW